MLVRLLYASRAVQPHTQDLLDSILAQSHAHNPANGLTGILCFSGDIFMQVLEGGRAEVSALYSRISADTRHHGVELLHFEEISERRFANWTMGQVNLAKVNPGTLLKYSEKPELNPFVVSGKASMALLEELIATAAIVGRVG
ncbi:BLUF domain-containing protein [Aquitalea sp. S1-19]|uniref:Blue light sensor protein n=1 Tax=Craterilacuibacter sinensis TaxID=2686017 RepID=A0A845BZB0_9NEIS|nr:BLUF domain-containing protein [Craterilacuibacter sinensis]MCP9758254.1 BLUF domain-containing protein [Aquitalea sp. S1-19]MXR37843.1 blue light sensor protein [Craterilacuibacter sinensis]RQW25385.1 BLUF domain-containing protein [Rhodobacteraceae bacterium CH30]